MSIGSTGLGRTGNARGIGNAPGRLAVLALTLALLASCALTPQVSAPTAVGTSEIPNSSTVTRSFAVGAAPELIVSDQVGAVSVEAGEAGKISVDAIKRADSPTAHDRIEVGMTQEGDVVRLTYELPRGMGAVSSGNPTVEFKVKVPAGAKVSVTTATGAIGVVSADGAVQAAADAGAITVDGILAGESWARTKAGAVTVRLPASASLKITAKGSQVKTDFGLPGNSGQVSGAIGVGSGGSLDVSALGLVQIVKR